jgi:AraC-like DNA-binding protein/ketosteroid isomerase-like protein
MQAAKFVRSYLDAWNRHDAQAVAEHMAENGTYLDVPDQKNMSREQLLAHLEKLFNQDTNFYELTGEVLQGKNTIAFQYKVHPRGYLDAGDSSETWYGAEFITLSSGMATEIADYYEDPGMPSAGSPIAKAAAARVKRYAKSGLSTSQMEEVKGQLTSSMEADQLYLRPDLTLPELAEALDCSVNHLSQAINAGFGMSFFDYLNRYRVKHAMRLLCPENGASPTILSVALEVGFNSTSTFYVAFKKVTGQTPAQYRRSLNA